MPSSTRVAVVGGGPAGIYVAEALVAQDDVPVAVDVIDRLPTPFGLLRYGVAPDHLKMKSLAGPLQRTLDDDRVRFLGNVEVGRDVSVVELRERYHAVVYTYGAATDRSLGIPGEDLPGSTSATEFVNWYSGHPDVGADRYDLSGVRTAVVVGVGNVAVDVARILVKDADQVAATDVPSGVAAVLRASAVTDVHVLGRRGPLDAKFTLKELRELGELDGVDVVVDPADLAVDPGLVETATRQVRGNYDVLRGWSERPPGHAPRRLHLHFHTSPVAGVGGTDGSALAGVEVRRNGDGPTWADGDTRTIEAQLLLRSVGYRGAGVDGIPFADATGTVPHDDFKVLRDDAVSPGEYVAGWIARGPSGVIGTNRSDGRRVAEHVLAERESLATPAVGEDLVDLLRSRGTEVVESHGWTSIDQGEVDLGATEGRARAKIATWEALLAAARG